jgi:hypothetical protein
MLLLHNLQRPLFVLANLRFDASYLVEFGLLIRDRRIYQVSQEVNELLYDN